MCAPGDHDEKKEQGRQRFGGCGLDHDEIGVLPGSRQRALLGSHQLVMIGYHQLALFGRPQLVFLGTLGADRLLQPAPPSLIEGPPYDVAF